MNCIVNEKRFYNDSILEETEQSFSIKIRSDIKDFIKTNSGGYPIKDVITINREDYEIRVFLSADLNDNYFCIQKPLEYFMNKTSGKIIPIAIDSGDNYYCVNNENGKVYFWNANEDRYYELAKDLNVFTDYFLL